MKTPDTLPDLRHLNHQIWELDINTIRLYLAVLELKDQKYSNEISVALLRALASKLQINPVEFLRILSILMSSGVFKPETLRYWDPREEPPIPSKQTDLIPGE